jgi:hypothetical protein
MNDGIERPQIAARFAHIEAIVEEKVQASRAAWEQLRLEIASERAKQPD